VRDGGAVTHRTTTPLPTTLHDRNGLMETTRFSVDRIGGLIWLVLGAAIVYGSWTMDRLEQLNIPPVTAPGVVPGLIGLGIMAFALVLILRRSRVATVDFSGSNTAEPQADESGFHWKRLAVSAFLCLAYGAVLLGRGVHYWILTAGFLFLHLLLLDESEDVPARPTLRRFLLAAALALAVSTAVTLVFQHVFLVRLP
jgi:hypothetical protein